MAVTLRLFLLLLLAAIAQAQSIVTLFNAASFGGGLPANSVAPGSLVTVQVIRGGPVVVNPDLGKVSLKLRPRAGGEEVSATVLRAFVNSYLAFLPRNTPLGTADVTLTVDGQANLPVTVEIVRAAPGIFARGAAGLGPALIHNDGPTTPPRLNLLTDPARPDDYLTLWLTGLGDATTGDVSVELAGIAVPAAYAGASPMFQGLDQVNIAIPPGLPESCFVSVLIKVRSAVSNESTFAFASNGSACQDPFGFSADQLKALDDGKTVRLGLISLRSEVMPAFGTVLNPAAYVRNEALFGEFAPRDLEGVALLAQPVVTDQSYFGCRLTSLSTVPRLTLTDNFDVGDNLHAETAGKSIDAPHPSVPVVYLKVLDPIPPQDPLFFSAGDWTIRAPGGRTHGAFQVVRRLPPPLRLENREALSQISRADDVTVRWAADGYGPDDVVTAILSVNNGAIACRALASSGRIRIPATLSASLPTAPAGQWQFRLTPRPDRRTRFTLPVVSGGAEPAVAEYLFTESIRATVR